MSDKFKKEKEFIYFDFDENIKLLAIPIDIIIKSS